MPINEARALANEARCFDLCIPPGMQLAVMNYLLYQIASGGGGGTSIDYLIIRDAPSAVEPDPANVTAVRFLTFRDGSPGKIWDPTVGAWI